MDLRYQDNQRHKRTFDEMSQRTPAAPSSFFFGHPTPSAPLDSPPSFYERRRTSHPHNHASQPSFTPRDNMAEPRTSQRPSLEHRSSQTIIDLTDDTGDSDSGPISSRFGQRFSQLGRSEVLALEDIIDLTDDVVDDDLEIIETRQISDPQTAPQEYARHRQLPQPRPRPLHDRNHRHTSLGFFVPNDLQHHRMGHHGELRHMGREILLGRPLARIGEVAEHIANNFLHWGPNDHTSILLVEPNLDYTQNPFQARRSQPKPQHQPPPDAGEGFTRSPAEDDVVICPACGNELVAKRTEEEPVVRKSNGKGPSKKDREEHPFWVLKECGHVYCNRCYQGRKGERKKPSTFPETAMTTGKMVPICAVEGCGKDVADKKHWVGIFM